jgi:hypothetical protein
MAQFKQLIDEVLEGEIAIVAAGMRFSSLGGRGWRAVGALRIAYFGIAYFGIAYFGIAYFEIACFVIAYFGVAYFGIAYFGTKESNCLLCGRLASFE